MKNSASFDSQVALVLPKHKHTFGIDERGKTNRFAQQEALKCTDGVINNDQAAGSPFD